MTLDLEAPVDPPARRSSEAPDEPVADDQLLGVLDAVFDGVVLAIPVRASLHPPPPGHPDGGEPHAAAVTDLVVWHANKAARQVGAPLPGHRLRPLIPEPHVAWLLDALLALGAGGADVTARRVELPSWPRNGAGPGGAFDLRATTVGESVLVAWCDVTDQVRLDEQLRDYRSGLEEAQQLGNIGSWAWDARRDLVRGSPQFHRIVGLGPSASTPGEMLRRRVAPADRARVEATLADALTSRQLTAVEARVIRPEGEVRHTITRALVVADEHGRVTGMRGTTQDITDLRRVEHARADAEHRLRREHEVVTALGDAIRPASRHRIGGWAIAARYVAPADESAIGGDWYDVFELPDGRLLAGVGDVAGTGLAAARVMWDLAKVLRAAAMVTGDPRATCSWLDQYLRLEHPSSFATALVVILDPRTGGMHWTRAGHLPAVRCRADGTTELLELGGRTPIGVPAPRDPPSPRTELLAGESLLLFTDGLVERRGEAIDEGFVRVAAAAQDAVAAGPELLCDRLIGRCLGGRTVTDDVCVLALTRSSAPAA